MAEADRGIFSEALHPSKRPGPPEGLEEGNGDYQDLQGWAVTRVCRSQGECFLQVSCLYKHCELIQISVLANK